MNTSYAEAVRSRGEGRQSSPTCNATARLPTSSTGDPTLATREQIQGCNVADMEMESNASSLTTQGQKSISSINPTKPSEGESLPDGYARNYAGFLIKTNKKRIHVSKELVAAEERLLQDHLIVASFIGGRLSPS